MHRVILACIVALVLMSLFAQRTEAVIDWCRAC